MTATAPVPPLILIAASPEHSLASVFEGRNYIVVQVHTGTLAGEWVRDVRPDMIIIDAELPDMSGIDACRLLHSDLRIGHTVPTLILTPNKPTPEQRVAALRTGVWDFLLYPPDREELLLSLETYLQAKRNIDVALAGLARLRGVRPGCGAGGPKGRKHRGPARTGVRCRGSVEPDRVRRARARYRSRRCGQARSAHRRCVARGNRCKRLLCCRASAPDRLPRRPDSSAATGEPAYEDDASPARRPARCRQRAHARLWGSLTARRPLPGADAAQRFDWWPARADGRTHVSAAAVRLCDPDHRARGGHDSDRRVLARHPGGRARGSDDDHRRRGVRPRERRAFPARGPAVRADRVPHDELRQLRPARLDRPETDRLHDRCARHPRVPALGGRPARPTGHRGAAPLLRVCHRLVRPT